MIDERELALKPIVGESVGHNARVSKPALARIVTPGRNTAPSNMTSDHDISIYR